jgi:hypothetical protein
MTPVTWHGAGAPLTGRGVILDGIFGQVRAWARFVVRDMAGPDETRLDLHASVPMEGLLICC